MSSKSRFLVGSLLGLCVCTATSACQYDTDKLFAEPAENPPDAGADTGVPALPADLIDLWAAADASEACAACARESCAEENTACRDDEQCTALTRCVAKSVDPRTTNDCRADHVDWLLEDVAPRDTGGPYQQCVFLNKCIAECDSRAQIACRGNFNWPQTARPTVDLHLLFVDGLSGLPPAGLKVRACQPEDSATCLEVASWQAADANGGVTLKVPVSLGYFQGYLELQGGGLYPTLLRFGWPISKDVVTGVTVVNAFSANALVNMSPVTVDMTRGLLQLRSFGCGGVPLRGVSFSVDSADAATSVWYTVGQEIVPRFDVTETGDRGAGGIVNVKAGRASVTARRDGVSIGSVTAPVRPGYMSIVVMLPGDGSSR